jgi:site-specific DNA recombinase
VVEVFRDEAISGASMHNRPGILRLMRAARSGAFDIVLTESLDRLSRSQADLGSLYEECKFLRISIEMLDRGGPASELNVGLEGTMNALYLVNLAYKTRRGQCGVAKQGRIPGGRCYGYDVVKGEERGLRTINERQAEVVRRIYHDYGAGVSLLAIVRALNDEGFPSPSGGKWNLSTLLGSQKRGNGVLSNELYAGRLVFNRQSFAKNPATGKRVSRINAPEDRIITEVPELRTVDEETWQAAQTLRASRTKPHPRFHRRPKHLLSGLLVCGECGASVIVKNTRDDVTYFGCSVHTNRGGCRNKKVARSDDIERRVLAGLKKLLLDPARIELAIDAYRAEWKRLRAERAKTRSNVERELAAAKAAFDRVMKAIHSPGGGEIDDLVQSLATLRQQRECLEAQLSVRKSEVVELHPHAARRYREIIEAFSASLARGGPPAAKAMGLVRSMITRVRVIPTSGRQPVGLEIEGNLLALISENGELRPDLANQTAPVAITV